MIRYNSTYDPPAPVLEVTVANASNRRRRRVLPGLLDTGSDITAVPATFVDTLQLYPIGRLRLEGVDATTQTVLTYAVHLTIGGVSVPRVEVILTGRDFAVIGRDILNRFYLLLRGPEQSFDLNTTSGQEIEQSE